MNDTRIFKQWPGRANSPEILLHRKFISAAIPGGHVPPCTKVVVGPVDYDVAVDFKELAEWIQRPDPVTNFFYTAGQSDDDDEDKGDTYVPTVVYMTRPTADRSPIHDMSNAPKNGTVIVGLAKAPQGSPAAYTVYERILWFEHGDVAEWRIAEQGRNPITKIPEVDLVGWLSTQEYDELLGREADRG